MKPIDLCVCERMCVRVCVGALNMSHFVYTFPSKKPIYIYHFIFVVVGGAADATTAAGAAAPPLSCGFTIRKLQIIPIYFCV